MRCSQCRKVSALESWQPEVGLYKDFLREILGTVVVGKITAVGEDTVLMTKDQLLKSTQVPFRSASYGAEQLFILVIRKLPFFRWHDSSLVRKAKDLTK